MEKVYIAFDSEGGVLFVSTNLDRLHKYCQKYLETIKKEGINDQYTIKEEILI
jgi:hypothetical protein